MKDGTNQFATTVRLTTVSGSDTSLAAGQDRLRRSGSPIAALVDDLSDAARISLDQALDREGEGLEIFQAQSVQGRFVELLPQFTALRGASPEEIRKKADELAQKVIGIFNE